jgi:hypothetical protein
MAKSATELLASFVFGEPLQDAINSVESRPGFCPHCGALKSVSNLQQEMSSVGVRKDALGDQSFQKLSGDQAAS